MGVNIFEARKLYFSKFFFEFELRVELRVGFQFLGLGLIFEIGISKDFQKSQIQKSQEIQEIPKVVIIFRFYIHELSIFFFRIKVFDWILQESNFYSLLTSAFQFPRTQN